jgi:uncharacterized protein YdaU (DUF1376 family)
MAKDPAFLFYPNDYIGGTMGMTFEEKGAYIELLMLQFNRGHMDAHMINHTVGQLWEKIKNKFIKDEQGLWFNERLDIEKTKRKAFSESRRNNISGKNQHTKGHMTNHMEDVNVNRVVNKNRSKVEILDTKFEEWWELYDYKISKKKAQSLWKSLTEQEKDLALQTVLPYIQSTPDKTYRKHPTTYLNQKCFNDEIINRNTTSQSRIAPKVTPEQLYEAHSKFFSERR